MTNIEKFVVDLNELLVTASAAGMIGGYLVQWEEECGTVHSTSNHTKHPNGDVPSASRTEVLSVFCGLIGNVATLHKVAISIQLNTKCYQSNAGSLMFSCGAIKTNMRVEHGLFPQQPNQLPLQPPGWNDNAMMPLYFKQPETMTPTSYPTR